MIRSILKVILSSRLIDILDKDKNGKISLKELRSITKEDLVEISGELGLTFIASLSIPDVVGWIVKVVF